MKRIEATIRATNLEAVRNRLAEIGIEEFTVTEVQAFGKEKIQAIFRGVPFEVSAQPRLLLILAAFDHAVDEIVDAIIEGARNGGVGDGTILVTALDEFMHIASAEGRRSRVRASPPAANELEQVGALHKH